MPGLEISEINDKPALRIFKLVGLAGWSMWTADGDDPDRCTIFMAPSTVDEPVVSAGWSRDPASGRTYFDGAEGHDGRELNTAAALLSFLLEETDAKLNQGELL